MCTQHTHNALDHLRTVLALTEVYTRHMTKGERLRRQLKRLSLHAMAPTGEEEAMKAAKTEMT